MDILYNFEEIFKEYGLTIETYEQLLLDCSNKVQKISDLDWSEICEKYNLDFNPDTIRKGSQPPLVGSAFVSEYYKWKESQNASETKGNSYLKELQIQKQETQKEIVKLRDERNELKRIIREEARKESYKEQILRSISEYQCNPLLYDENKEFTGILKTDNDLVCTVFDVHTGLNVDNYFNTFNENVLKQRLNQYLDKIFEVQIRHGSENINVILSELVSGIIHLALRIENNQNLIEQFLTITNYLSQFLAELSYHFSTVNVYVCPGNHSRCQAKKEDNLRGENMDLLAIPYLEAKLQNFENVKFYNNIIDSSIAIFSVRGQKVFAVHGDKDSMDNVTQKLTMYTSIRPDIIFMGHHHTNAMLTSYDTKVIQAGCLSGGADEYCMDKRLRNKAEQIISVITDNGLDCIYDVKFS